MQSQMRFISNLISGFTKHILGADFTAKNILDFTMITIPEYPHIRV